MLTVTPRGQLLQINWAVSVDSVCLVLPSGPPPPPAPTAAVTPAPPPAPPGLPTPVNPCPEACAHFLPSSSGAAARDYLLATAAAIMNKAFAAHDDAVSVAEASRHTPEPQTAPQTVSFPCACQQKQAVGEPVVRVQNTQHTTHIRWSPVRA